jgi:hypothetical protein
LLSLRMLWNSCVPRYVTVYEKASSTTNLLKSVNVFAKKTTEVRHLGVLWHTRLSAPACMSVLDWQAYIDGVLWKLLGAYPDVGLKCCHCLRDCMALA